MKQLLALILIASFAVVLTTGCSNPADKALETAAPPVANPKKESKPAGFVPPAAPPTMAAPGEKPARGSKKSK